MRKFTLRNGLTAVFFLAFICVIACGTVAKAYTDRDTYREVYGAYLNDNYSAVSKVKALLLTAYESAGNTDAVLFKRTAFIDIFGFAQRVTGNRFVRDSAEASANVVKLNNGYLSFAYGKRKELPEKAARIAAFSEELGAQGVDLLYVQYPFKLDKDDKQLPIGVEEYSNEASDEILGLLRQRGVATLDIRERIKEEKPDHYSLFFRTDHHWKPETGLWATEKICETLNRDNGFNIDLSKLDTRNFTSAVYKNWFLGSQGKRVGRFYAGTDDFTFILPAYDTDMACVYHRKNGTTFKRTGSFEDTFVFYDHLREKEYFERNTYAVYTGGDYKATEHTNFALNDKKILLIRDSYSCVVTPFLSLAACKELRTIDPRYFDGSIQDYIAEFQPDIVLLLYYPTALSNNRFFDFD